MKTMPETRVIEYRQTVYVCSNGGHDAGVVYRWREKWHCSACLKKAVRAAGGTASDVYNCSSAYAFNVNPEFRATEMRRAKPMQRVTPYTYPFHITTSKRKTKQLQWCDDCEREHALGLCEVYI